MRFVLDTLFSADSLLLANPISSSSYFRSTVLSSSIAVTVVASMSCTIFRQTPPAQLKMSPSKNQRTCRLCCLEFDDGFGNSCRKACCNLQSCLRSRESLVRWANTSQKLMIAATAIKLAWCPPRPWMYYIWRLNLDLDQAGPVRHLPNRSLHPPSHWTIH